MNSPQPAREHALLHANAFVNLYLFRGRIYSCLSKWEIAVQRLPVHMHKTQLQAVSHCQAWCADSPAVSICPTASPVLVTPKVEEHFELDDSEPGEQNTRALSCTQPWVVTGIPRLQIV